MEKTTMIALAAVIIIAVRDMAVASAEEKEAVSQTGGKNRMLQLFRFVRAYMSSLAAGRKKRKERGAE